MPVVNYAHLPADELRVLEQDVASHASLIDALTFVSRHHNRLIVPTVVVQDEYSHDVVFPWRDRLHLVYATT